MELNTIILLYGSKTFSSYEFNHEIRNNDFHKGRAIWGIDSYPIELKRWNISEEEALKELAKYKCSYAGYYDCYYNGKFNGNLYVEEYALHYCGCDADGEFLFGGDYELAEDETEVRAKEIAKLLQEGDNRDPRLLKELCELAALKREWEYACDYEECLASGDAEEGDDDTCEEVTLIAAERLGVKI